jgi:RNase adaptor protein for sRNA GlmZ degradation
MKPLATDPAHTLHVISFGHLHLRTALDGQPLLPAADRVEDVRYTLRDPAAARGLLDLDGHDPRVQQVVLNTHGARELLDDLAADALRLSTRPRTFAIGCSGGRHRAAALSILLARELLERGMQVHVRHLHAHLPRVLKAG